VISAVPTASAIRTAAARTRTAADDGLRWLLARIADDGEPAGAFDPRCVMQPFFRLPWTLSAAGERAAASAVLTWIEAHALAPDGDLLPEARQGFVDRWASYPLACLALGATQLERHDVVRRVGETLRRFRNPESGGAYGERPEVRRTEREDLFPTAQLGMSALAAGDEEVAAGCFRWIADVHAAQPELPARLYTACGPDGLLTQPAPAVEWEVVTDFTRPRQAFYNPGIAAAFLGRYALATGDERARNLGRAFLELTAGGTAAQFDHRESKQVCKYAWGRAVMVDADPDGDHLPELLRMVDWFVDSQLPDGRWRDSPFKVPDPTEADDLRVTAEFVLHLTTALAALGSSAART
jgi:hypothetical protein